MAAFSISAGRSWKLGVTGSAPRNLVFVGSSDAPASQGQVMAGLLSGAVVLGVASLVLGRRARRVREENAG